MPLMHASERVLFDRVIVEAELDVDDFEITKEKELPGVPPQQVGTGWIIVLYKPTGIKCQYRDGVVPSAYDGVFPRDLRMNTFKTR